MFIGEIVGTVVIGFLVVGVLGWALTLYNSLVALRNNIGRSWANIDVLLKQRHDELPKLVETCKQYMKFEQDTLARVSAPDARRGMQQ